MSGAIVDLVSKGVQDVYITDDKGMSLFKMKYQRHTNFAQAPKQLNLIGQTVSNNGQSVIKIESLGDLVNHIWLEGDDLVQNLSGSVFDLYIGGQKVDSQTFDFKNEIWQVYLSETWTKSMNGNISSNKFFPLHFFFCDNEMFLPILSLQYHEVEIRVTWGSSVSGSASTLKCYANFVYLDTTEREEMIKKPMDLMITQVQRYTYPVSNGLNQVDLSVVNHPVKSLFFGFEKQGIFTPNDSLTFAGADLQINGTYVFENMSPLFFHTVQSYYKTKYGRVNYNNTAEAPNYTRYFMYNFCIDASSYKPTGTCNFSRLDNSKLTLKGVSVASERSSSDLLVYAVNYNILRIKSGIAGILFAN